MIYTLKRIRINPLEQILQQERYISLAPESHKVVFSPFVEEVKSIGYVSPYLYVNTLVRLTKAHLFEKSYVSAYNYGMDALQFYESISDDTFSDEEYMDLFFTVALSCHRVGMSEKVLEYLERMHILMVTKLESTLINLFGRRTYAELLVIFARTLITNVHEGTGYTVRSELLKHAKQLYRDARRIDTSNMHIMIDMLNMLVKFEDKLQVEELLIEMLEDFSDLEDVIPNYSNNQDQSDTSDDLLSEPEVLYDRKTYINDELYLAEEISERNEFDILFDVSVDQMSSENTISDIQAEMQTADEELRMEEENIDEDKHRDALVDETQTESAAAYQDIAIENHVSEHTTDQTNLHMTLNGFEVIYDREEYLRTEIEGYTEADLWKINRTLLKDYYQMKAFQEIKMEDKVNMIRNRLEIKMNNERRQGILVSFEMLESLYKLYESQFRSRFRQQLDFEPDTFFIDIVSNDDVRIIYSTADKLLLDDMVNSLFTLVDSTVIRIPIKIFFLHLIVRYNKLQGNINQAKEALQQMEYMVESSGHAVYSAVGQHLLASHLKSFGQTELANELFASAREKILNSKDTFDPPSVKYQVIKWIHEVFTTVLVNEPYNRYLDDIFSV